MSFRHPRFLSTLRDSVKQSRDPYEADCLRAEYAGNLARYERISEAQALIEELRSRYDQSPNVRVTPWIMFASSMIERSLGRADASLLQMRRANALSAAAGAPRLRAVSAAGLSHMYWNRENVDAAAAHVREAFHWAAPNDHVPRYRASLVLGEIFALSRRDDLAQPWFVKARGHATALGDDRALSALAFNLATVRLMMLRQSSFGDSESEATLENTVFFGETSRSVDKVLGIPIDALTILQQAQIFSMQGNPASSLALYKAGCRVVDVPLARLRATWLSDAAWCYARLGELERARQVACEAGAALAMEMQVDDRAVVHSRLSLVFTILGESATAAEHSRLSTLFWDKYKVFQQQCVYVCTSITDGC